MGLGAPRSRSAIAIKDKKIAFVAHDNGILAGTSPFKALSKIGFPVVLPSKVQDLVLNQAEVFLAIVGLNSVVVADLSLVKDSDPQFSKKIQAYALKSLKSPIVGAAWHPASSTQTHLVVLTATSVAVFDVAISCLAPQFEVHLKEFPELADQKVISMAFGSTTNYIGSTTLYISTSSGRVYGISPLVYEGFSQCFSGNMLMGFLAEAKEVIALCEEKVPPSSIFNPFRLSLHNYQKQTDIAENLYINLNIAKFPGSKIWSFKCIGTSAPCLVGPVADLGSECKLFTIAPTLEFTALSAISKSSNDELVISYLAQLYPFLFAFQPVSNLLQKPTKPTNSTAPVTSNECYVKPRRGFGYSVETNEDVIASETKLKAQAAYGRELHDYSAQQSISLFFDSNFNQMSLLSSDIMDVKIENLNDVIVGGKNDWLVVGSPEVIMSSNLSKALELVMDPSVDTFDAEYLQTPFSGTGFAVLECDSVSNLQISFHTKDLQSLSLLEFKDKEKKQLALSNSSSYESETRGKSTPEKYTLPSKELSDILGRALFIPHLQTVDIESSQSLQNIHETSIAAVERVRDLTAFIFTLQSILAIQHCELKFQRCGLKENCSKNIASPIDNAIVRYKKCIERQMELTKKSKKLHQRVLDSFEKSKKQVNLPLSDAERVWFKELNTITKKIGVNKDDEQSLQLIVDNLNKKVIALRNDKGTFDALNNHALEKAWSKLNFVLNREGSLIKRTKDDLDDLLHRVGEINVGIPI